MDEQLIGGATKATPTPALGLADQSATDSNPKVDFINTGRQVIARIVRDASASPCEFWFGLAKSGSHAPLGLLGEKPTDDLLKIAATEGISESGPVVLFDAKSESPRGLLLMPLPEAKYQDQTGWLDSLITTLLPWSPDRIGIYLAPEAIGTDPSMELLSAVLHRIVQNTRIREIFLLTGNHGTNHLLNAALRLKQELTTDEFELYVYH